MELKDLTPHPRNPRKITDEKLAMLKKSLDTFGDLSGIVYNVKTKNLVGGHQRLKVLPPSSIVTVTPCPETKCGTVGLGQVSINGELFTYREVSWDETKEKAANIAANQHGGEWNMSILPDWVLQLDQSNMPLELLGFDQMELANMMAPIEEDSMEEKAKEFKLCPHCGKDIHASV